MERLQVQFIHMRLGLGWRREDGLFASVACLKYFCRSISLLKLQTLLLDGSSRTSVDNCFDPFHRNSIFGNQVSLWNINRGFHFDGG